jgi:type II secretory pathway pseudopilin PulG|tara:strand:- start:475 stop:894 length:420 start_codon:yes stop_codon:yes gene_type:complete
MLGIGAWIMSKVLIGIVLVLLAVSYYLYSQNQILQANNSSLESAVATQEEAIKSIQEEFELQTKQLQDLTVKSQAAQRELSRYTQFIQNYELASKILADPIEMERKINNGTKHIMEDIEKLSGTVDSLDNGLQLQSTSD